MSVNLYEHQRAALKEMHNGCILCGGVGSGKSRTALAYYYILCGGQLKPNFKKMTKPMDLYIITTAKKRDSSEWEAELVPFLISRGDIYKINVKIDSWNNIAKYVDIGNAFFIFDEQRVVGKGAWVKAFLHISKYNKWILLSATPGDTWLDYIPVFVANGFYRNRSEFMKEHVIFKRYAKFPSVERFIGTKKLERLRDMVLVDMDFDRSTVRHYEVAWCQYNSDIYKQTMKERWNPFNKEPIINAAGLCYILRRIVNGDSSRIKALLELIEKHKKAIVFYNFDYELDLIKGALEYDGILFKEWNGHKHEPVPEGECWVYLVQYGAGCEGWNCITTDTIIFFSQNYSYKVVEQASGRIDRLNTPYKDLWYYTLKSRAPIDLAIARALDTKKNFNESRFYMRFERL